MRIILLLAESDRPARLAETTSIYRNFSPVIVNHFTAPACKLSGLNGARTRLKNSTHFAPVTSTFSAIPFDESPFTCQCERKTKRLQGFKFRTFICRF